MARTLEQVGDDFLTTAPLVIPAVVEVPNSPQQVWDALGSDEMWSWFPVIDKLRWATERPHTQGCVRELRIARKMTVTEEFYRWEEPHRATFRVTETSHGAIKGLAEDFLLEELPDGGTRITWIMAVAPAGPRPPRALSRLLAPGNKRALKGIRKILPPA